MVPTRDRPNLFGMTTYELENLCEQFGEPRYRGRQIANWLYRRNASDISVMSNLPERFRQTLVERTTLNRARIVESVTAPDGTTKLLLEFFDCRRVECVLLPFTSRVSVCVSSQVGCPVGCVFCATALGGFVRNLTAGEIVDQVLTLQCRSPRRITHVVYMGMGEPLLNYGNFLKSLRLLSGEVGIGMRHITLSTVGITPAIFRLAQERLQITLAVSLHAPDDALRARMIPIAKRYPLRDLLEACRIYAETTGRRITFEYLLINDLNDSPALAYRLASLLKGMLCAVNLIPYNVVSELPFSRPHPSRINAFRSILERAGIPVTQRLERGHTVAAACGQLTRR